MPGKFVSAKATLSIMDRRDIIDFSRLVCSKLAQKTVESELSLLRTRTVHPPGSIYKPTAMGRVQQPLSTICPAALSVALSVALAPSACCAAVG